MTAADRPLTDIPVPGIAHNGPNTDITDNARAAAERLWPSYRTIGFSGAEDRQAAFVAGAEWAAGRAETTTDCGGCRGLGKHSPRCHTQPGYLWRRRADRAESLADEIGANDAGMANRLYAVAGECRARAETTTATTEDALDSLPYFTFEDDDVAPDEEFVRKADVARLLATARTRPTRQQLIDVLREHDPDNYGGQDAAAWYYEAQADAVLALLEGGGDQ